MPYFLHGYLRGLIETEHIISTPKNCCYCSCCNVGQHWNTPRNVTTQPYFFLGCQLSHDVYFGIRVDSLCIIEKRVDSLWFFFVQIKIVHEIWDEKSIRRINTRNSEVLPYLTRLLNCNTHVYLSSTSRDHIKSVLMVRVGVGNPRKTW